MSAISIFSPQIPEATSVWTRYHVELQVRDKIIGGIPKDADTIKKWLAARLELDDRVVLELAEETAAQMEAAQGTRPTGDALVDAIARATEGGNGFKTIDGGLVFEGRCIKSCLKEAANVAFPGVEWPGKTDLAKGFRKGLMGTFAERVFVPELYIPLGVTTPSGTEQRIKHIMTPQGPRSAINVVDFITKPRLSFTVQVLRDFLKPEVWSTMWQLAEEIGIGADRARSDGKFDLVAWDPIGD